VISYAVLSSSNAAFFNSLITSGWLRCELAAVGYR
jgi:hypothetical protein